MNGFESGIRHWWLHRFPGAVRVGWAIANNAARNTDLPRLGLGLALIGYGFARRRGEPRLIYKTSIDVGQGTMIRVMRGRRPIAETAPLP